MTSYKVLAPYVTLRVSDSASGTDVLVGYYAGAPVPPNANREDVARLARKGMIVDADSLAGEVLAVPAGTPIPGEPPNVPVTETPVSGASLDERVRRAQDALGAGTTEPGARPKDYAPKPEWVEYAVSKRDEGVAEDEARAAAEAKTQRDLIAEFGG